jgi:hypothetical protein
MSVRVLCCYSQLHPVTAAALRQHAPQAELVDVSGSPFRYGQELTARWDGAGDLLNVEHDIEITGRVLPELASCSGDWCVFTYWLRCWIGIDAQGLGCTRFSARVQERVDRADLLGPFANPCGCAAPGCWHNLDKVVTSAVAMAGFRPCVHDLKLRHLRRAGA